MENTRSSSTVGKFVSKEEINRAYNLLSQSVEGKEEDYFGVVYIAKKFSISLQEATKFIAFNGGIANSGIDGYYFDKEKKSFYLFVFRWSEDHTSFKDALDNLGKNGIYNIFVNIMRSPEDSPVFVALKTTLFQNRKVIDRVFVNFVFNGDPVDAEQSKVLAYLRETIEDKQAIVQSFLSRVGEPDYNHNLVFQYVSNQTSLGNVVTSRKTREYIITFEDSLNVSSSIIISNDKDDEKDASTTDSKATKAEYHNNYNNIKNATAYLANGDGNGEDTKGKGSNSGTRNATTDNATGNAGSSKMTVFFIPLYNLYEMYQELGDRFFEKNLRSGLDEGKMTNMQIRDSLRRIIHGNEDHSNFTLYHNGVTLYAQVLEFKDSNTLRMVEPRILNGAQTVKILKQFVDEEIKLQQNVKKSNAAKTIENAAAVILSNAAQADVEDNGARDSKLTTISGNNNTDDDIGNNKTGDQTLESPSSVAHSSSFSSSPTSLLSSSIPEEFKNKLMRIRVLARMVQSQNEEFLKNITVNNNRQNPIMPWNLRANDITQIGFEELFGKLSIYYERRENAYKNLIEEDPLFSEGGSDASDLEKGVIEIRKFAQTLLAVQGNVDKISEIKEVFENEKWYHDTFAEHYLEADPRIFVLLYKIQFRLQSITREIRTVGAEKYGYVSKARNLLWCLCVQGILNDGKLDKLLESYGSSVNVELALTELFKTLATTKLRFILSDTFEDPKYKDAIAQGRFSFLKAKGTLVDCMKIAEKRFGWQKKTI